MSVLTCVTERLTAALGEPKGSLKEEHASFQRVLGAFPADVLSAAVNEYLDTRKYNTWPKPVELKALCEKAAWERTPQMVFVPKGEHPHYTPDWSALAEYLGKDPDAMPSYSHGGTGWYFAPAEIEAARARKASA